MKRYIENRNKGTIALIKRKGKYEYNAIDSAYCVIGDYEKDIQSEVYFDRIKSTQLDYVEMVNDFKDVLETTNNTKIRNYLIWEKPNILFDFDSKYLVNYDADRVVESVSPKAWRCEFVKEFWKLKKHIPIGLRYWNTGEIVVDYLNQFSNESEIEEELKLIEKALSFTGLKSYDERWNKFERELGGNVYENKDFGWLSKVNYVPSIVMNRD